MVEYLTLFDTHAEYLESKSGLTLPNVSSCLNDYAGHFNPLPYDYEVDYLESTGSQYIDTGIKLNTSYKLEVEANTTGSTETAIGARIAANNKQHDITFPSQGAYARWKCGGGKDIHVMVPITFGNWYHYVGDFGTFYVNGTSYTLSNPISTTADISYYLFATNTNGTVSNLGAKKIRMARIWNGDVLLRDFVPVVKDGVGYMYDKVSHQLFGNIGTGAFSFGERKSELLFDAEIEYLEGDGFSYIDTGVLPKLDYRSVVRYFLVTPLNNDRDASATLFGVFDAWKQNGYGIFHTPSKNQMYGMLGNKDVTIGSANSYANGWHTAELSGGKVIVDGVQKGAMTSYSGNPTKSCHLYKTNYSSSNYGAGTIKRISSFKMYDSDNNLVIDYIPVRKGSVGYMYDKVTNRLFGNLGTGDFALGPDKPFDYKTIYYGII